jgi:hypothetical protein
MYELPLCGVHHGLLRMLLGRTVGPAWQGCGTCVSALLPRFNREKEQREENENMKMMLTRKRKNKNEKKEKEKKKNIDSY